MAQHGWLPSQVPNVSTGSEERMRKEIPSYHSLSTNYTPGAVLLTLFCTDIDFILTPPWEDKRNNFHLRHEETVSEKWVNFQVSTACKWFESTPLTSGPPVTSALKTYIHSLGIQLTCPDSGGGLEAKVVSWLQNGQTCYMVCLPEPSQQYSKPQFLTFCQVPIRGNLTFTLEIH